MKKIMSTPRLTAPMISIALVVSVMLTSCNNPLFLGTRLNGSGNLKTETRAVSGFNKIALSGLGELVIQQTGAESLSIEADDNLLPYLTSDVRDGTLHLDIKPNTNFNSVKRIRYVVTVKSLEGILNSGLGQVTGSDIRTDNLKVSISGAGGVELSGEATHQDINLSGLGNIEFTKLKGKTALISMSGGGTARVNVSDALDVSISGLGNVEYLGNPVVKQEISGAGRVTKVGG